METRINRTVIATDGTKTTMSPYLKVTFQNLEDEKQFREMIDELGAQDDCDMQLYVLTSMSFAGVRFNILN